MLFSYSYANTTAKLENVEKQIQQNKAKLKPKIQERRRAEAYMSTLKKKIKQTEINLNKTKRYLNKISLEEKEAIQSVEQSQKTFNSLQQSFADRLKHIFMSTPIQVTDILFNDTMIQLNDDNRYFIQKVLKEDMALIQQIRSQKHKLEQDRLTLQEKREKIVQLKKDILAKESVLKKNKHSQRLYISNLTTQIKKLESQNKELDRLSRELTDIILKAAKDDTYYATGDFLLPVKGWISSRYGMRMHPIFKRKIMHTGIDIAAPKGYKIRAANSGKVLFSGTKGGYGKSVLIYHGKRPSDKKAISSFYAHASRLVVKAGDVVRKGDEIAYVGATGYATGPHLHLEIKIDGNHADPLLFIKK